MCSFGSYQTRFEFLSQFRKVRNAFECFVNTGANAFAKNQTRLAYEDKRDLYCSVVLVLAQWTEFHLAVILYDLLAE